MPIITVPQGISTSVIPALSRNAADARQRGVKIPFSPRTWAERMPAQGRYDGKKEAASYMEGMLPSSHDDVRTQFHHTVGRQAEIVRRIGRGFSKGDEQTILPAWHARFRIRHQLAAPQVK